MIDYPPPKKKKKKRKRRYVQGQVTSFEKVTISRKLCKAVTWLQWKTNKKSYLAYRMVSLSVTLSDLGSRFLTRIPGEMYVLSTISLNMKKKRMRLVISTVSSKMKGL